MTARVLPEALAEAAEKHAGTLAVLDDDAARTYAQVQADAARVAGGLATMGLAPGDRLAFQLPNSGAWLSAFWGGVMAGCVVVPLNPRNRPAEIAYMLERCEASLLVPADGTDAPSSGARSCLVADLLGDSILEAPAGGAVAEPDDVALIVFTSGSTGYPKGAMLSHGGLLEDGRALRAAWGLETGEAVVVPSPLSHVLGLVAGCIVPTLAGATLLTMAAFDAGRALRSRGGPPRGGQPGRAHSSQRVRHERDERRRDQREPGGPARPPDHDRGPGSLPLRGEGGRPGRRPAQTTSRPFVATRWPATRFPAASRWSPPSPCQARARSTRPRSQNRQLPKPRRRRPSRPPSAAWPTARPR